MNKNILKIGDLIKFHNWAIGGFLFGIIIEHENEEHNKELCIWRPKTTYLLKDVDAISVINDVDDVNECDIHDVQDLLEEAKKHNVFVKKNELWKMMRN